MDLRNKISPLKDKLPPVNPLKLGDSNIVMVFDYSIENDYAQISDFVENFSKKLNVKDILLINNSDRKLEIYTDEKYKKFSLNDVSLTGTLNSNIREWINNRKFDLLLSFCKEDNLLNNRIITDVNSDFKAGISGCEYPQIFDLTIDHNSSDYKKQLDNYIHYLTKLKINI